MSETFHDYVIGLTIELTKDQEDALGRLLAKFVQENSEDDLCAAVIWGKRSPEVRYVK